jgi:hypothetical protein
MVGGEAVRLLCCLAAALGAKMSGAGYMLDVNMTTRGRGGLVWFMHWSGGMNRATNVAQATKGRGQGVRRNWKPRKHDEFSALGRGLRRHRRKGTQPRPSGAGPDASAIPGRWSARVALRQSPILPSAGLVEHET